jgi:hypothetical protein
VVQGLRPQAEAPAWLQSNEEKETNMKNMMLSVLFAVCVAPIFAQYAPVQFVSAAISMNLTMFNGASEDGAPAPFQFNLVATTPYHGTWSVSPTASFAFGPWWSEGNWLVFGGGKFRNIHVRL